MSKTAVNIAILVGATGVCGLMGFAASMMAPKTEEEINDRSFRKVGVPNHVISWKSIYNHNNMSNKFDVLKCFLP